MMLLLAFVPLAFALYVPFCALAPEPIVAGGQGGEPMAGARGSGLEQPV